MSIPPRTKTLRDDRPELNQWGSEDFWHAVQVASFMTLSQIEPTAVPDHEAIEAVVLFNILFEVTEAGTA